MKSFFKNHKALAAVLAVIAAVVIFWAPIKAQVKVINDWQTFTAKQTFKGGIGLTGSYGITGAGVSTLGATSVASLASTAGISGTTIAGTAVSGTTGTFTDALTGIKSIITVTTDTTLSAAQCRGTVVYCSTADSNSTVTITMPTLAAGYDVTFIDNDLDSGADMEIQMATGDKVNGGTAAKMLKHVSTSVGAVHLVAVDATDFVEVSTPTDSSNWTNDNN